MKNSAILLLGMISMVGVYYVEKQAGHIMTELSYFIGALHCTFWIVKAIEDK